jgi:hypothetical protein
VRRISANAIHTSSGQFSTLRGVYGAAYTNDYDATGTNIQGIYGSAYIGQSNATVTNLIGGYFTAGAVSGMATTSGTNVVAGQFRALAGGSGDFNVTNTYGVQILTPGATHNGTLTNLYGLYIEDMTSSSMSFANEYNIYSAGATSQNYFEGNIFYDGTISGTGDIYCNDLYTAGGISVAGDISFIGSGSGMIYGEIFANNVSGTVTITSSGKSNRVQIDTFDNNGLSNGNITPDHTNDHITIGVDGHYMLTCSISCENSPGLAATYGFSAYKNNGSVEFTNCHSHRAMAGAGGDTGSISMNGIIACYANDTIEVWMWNEDNTNNVIVDDITLSLVQIGGIEPL